MQFDIDLSGLRLMIHWQNFETLTSHCPIKINKTEKKTVLIILGILLFPLMLSPITIKGLRYHCVANYGFAVHVPVASQLLLNLDNSLYLTRIRTVGNMSSGELYICIVILQIKLIECVSNRIKLKATRSKCTLNQLKAFHIVYDWSPRAFFKLIMVFSDRQKVTFLPDF